MPTENQIAIQGGVVLSMVGGDPPRRADVMVRGRTIAAVTEPARNAPPSPPDVTTIDATGCLVMPGLINAHTHTPMTLSRGTMEGVGFPSPKSRPTMPPGQDWRPKLTAEDHEVAARCAIAEMIRSGTTTFVDMYHDMDRVARAVVDTGIRGALGWEIISFRSTAKEWVAYDEKRGRQSFEASARFATDWHGKGDGRVTAWIAPHETSTCHEPWLSRAAQLAAEMRLGITMHLAESPGEVQFCRDKYGATPVEVAARAGILGHRVVGAHCVHLTDGDVGILSGTAFSAAACLGCYLKLATTPTPVPRLLAAGINVALGTDSALTNNNLNLWDEVYLNGTIHNFVAGDPALVSAEAALRLATVGGARALGMEQDLGTVQAGKRADLIVVDLRRPHLTPQEGVLIPNLVFSGAGSDVRDVLVDGRVLMRDRVIQTFDEAALLDSARRIVRTRRAAVGLPEGYAYP